MWELGEKHRLLLCGLRLLFFPLRFSSIWRPHAWRCGLFLGGMWLGSLIPNPDHLEPGLLKVWFMMGSISEWRLWGRKEMISESALYPMFLHLNLYFTQCPWDGFVPSCWSADRAATLGKVDNPGFFASDPFCSVLYCGGWPRQDAPFQAPLSLWEAESLSSGSFSSPRPQVLPAGTSPRCLWLCLVTLPIETAPSLGPHPVVVLVSCCLWVTSPFLVTFQQLSCS